MIGWIQAIKIRKQEFDRLEKIQNCYKLHLDLRRKSVCFRSFYEENIFLFSKTKTLKINAPNSFFQDELNFFYIILDFLNKFLKT